MTHGISRAFTKSGRSRAKESKGFKQVSIEMAACVWEIAPTRAVGENNDQVIEGGEVLGQCLVVETRGIFVQGFVAAVMKAILNLPVTPDSMIEARRTSLLWVETGNAIDNLVPKNVVVDFGGGADACVAFQFEDLCATWPGEIAE
jgi:hypothetical protein